MNAFITGSHAYGTPKEGSDLDLVVCADNESVSDLWEFSESKSSCRYGKLNIITLTPDNFERWKQVNDALMADAPVSREQAVAAFQAVGFGLDNYGFPYGEDI